MVRHGWLLDAALEIVRDSVPKSEARTDLEATLRAIDPRFLGLIGDVLEGEAKPKLAVPRGAAVVLQVASIQLADDLADQECSYLEDAVRRGPGAQALLQLLAYQSMLKAELGEEALLRALSDLSMVGVAQQREVSRTDWDATSYLELAREINGHQHAAYLTILCCHSAERELRSMGIAFGTCAHVVGDAFSWDARWRRLSEDARCDVARVALGECTALLAHVLPALRPHVAALHRLLGDLACAPARPSA